MAVNCIIEYGLLMRRWAGLCGERVGCMNGRESQYDFSLMELESYRFDNFVASSLFLLSGSYTVSEEVGCIVCTQRSAALPFSAT